MKKAKKLLVKGREGMLLVYTKDNCNSSLKNQTLVSSASHSVYRKEITCSPVKDEGICSYFRVDRKWYDGPSFKTIRGLYSCGEPFGRSATK